MRVTLQGRTLATHLRTGRAHRLTQGLHLLTDPAWLPASAVLGLKDAKDIPKIIKNLNH